MDFEELKVEIPVDNDDEEEKDFPFNLVTKRDMGFITHFFHLFKHLWIFLLYFASQERRYENKSGCFVTGFDVTSKVNFLQIMVSPISRAISSSLICFNSLPTGSSFDFLCNR